MPVSLHSHASSVPLFNGLNFFDWWEQVQFHLGVLDLDLALQVEKPATITDKSSTEEKALHKAWEKIEQIKLNVHANDSCKQYKEHTYYN